MIERAFSARHMVEPSPLGLRLPAFLRGMFAGLERQRVLREQAKIKKRLTQALLIVADGKRPAAFARRLTQREHGVLILAGVELLALVRGAPAERILRVLTHYDAGPALQQWLTNPNPLLRAKAAEGLSYLVDADGCLALMQALNDENEDVRVAAATSLVKIGVAPPVEDLMTAFQPDMTPSARLWRMLDAMREHQPDDAVRMAEHLKLDGVNIAPMAHAG